MIQYKMLLHIVKLENIDLNGPMGWRRIEHRSWITVLKMFRIFENVNTFETKSSHGQRGNMTCAIDLDHLKPLVFGNLTGN